MQITLNINRVPVELVTKPGETLLSALRRSGYFGAKHGCEDGSCEPYNPAGWQAGQYLRDAGCPG